MSQIIFPILVVCAVCAALFGLVCLAARLIEKWDDRKKSKIY